LVPFGSVKGLLESGPEGGVLDGVLDGSTPIVGVGLQGAWLHGSILSGLVEIVKPLLSGKVLSPLAGVDPVPRFTQNVQMGFALRVVQLPFEFANVSAEFFLDQSGANHGATLSGLAGLVKFQSDGKYP
jgi:hypothetical protein